MSNVHLSSAAALERLAARRTFPLHARTGVCRNLFGPVDHDELDRELKGKLRELRDQSRRRWEYDFQSEAPLAGGPGRLQWEAVAGEAVPAFYRESLQVGRCRFPVQPLRAKPPAAIPLAAAAAAAEAPSPETDSGAPAQEGCLSAAPAPPLSPPGKTAAVESGAPPSDGERLERENRAEPLSSYSGIILKPVPCAATALKRASSASVAQITDFFAKRKRGVDSRAVADPTSALPVSVAALPVEQTPRKRLR